VVDPASERRAPSGMRAWLESPVREAAQVYVNGKAAGAVWTAPFEIEINRPAHIGREHAPCGGGKSGAQRTSQGPLPDYKELTAKYGEKFQAQDMESVRSLPAACWGRCHWWAKVSGI